jgi:hypothetical protein
MKSRKEGTIRQNVTENSFKVRRFRRPPGGGGSSTALRRCKVGAPCVCEHIMMFMLSTESIKSVHLFLYLYK